jgi:hypothetical protein
MDAYQTLYIQGAKSRKLASKQPGVVDVVDGDPARCVCGAMGSLKWATPAL